MLQRLRCCEGACDCCVVGVHAKMKSVRRVLFCSGSSNSSDATDSSSAQSIIPLDATFIKLTVKDRFRLSIVAGCVIGMLPLLQAHSFFGVGVVVLVAALMEVPRCTRIFYLLVCILC
jgi:hypothetical protein